MTKKATAGERGLAKACGHNLYIIRTNYKHSAAVLDRFIANERRKAICEVVAYLQEAGEPVAAMWVAINFTKANKGKP